MFLAKDQDGTVAQLEIGDDEDFGRLLGGFVVPENGAAPVTGEEPAAFAPADARVLAQSLEPGTALAFLLVEHHWAALEYTIVVVT